MGFGGAAGRLVELGERKRRAQARSCARLAPSRWRWRSGRLPRRARDWRDRACSRISPRRRCRKASRERCSTCSASRQRFVDARQRAVRVPASRLELREQSVKNGAPSLCALLDVSRQRLSKLAPRPPPDRRADRAPNPRYNSASSRPERHPMLSADSLARPLPRSTRAQASPRRISRMVLKSSVSAHASRRGRARSRAGSPARSVRARGRPRPDATSSARG